MQRALFVLTSSEGKRLVAKGVRELPELRKALQCGKVIIAGGTTNAFVAEELTGRRLAAECYTAGIVTRGRLCVTPRQKRISPLVIINGNVVDTNWEDALDDFGPEDVFIKGANAIDATGMAGVMVASPNGGTIGKALGILAARGSRLIVPVGLEKMIPSVQAAAKSAGNMVFQHSLGMPVGVIPLVNGKVVTEVTALEILGPVQAVALGAGGVGGSEGSVTIAISGGEEAVGRVMDLIRGIKGEPPVPGIKQGCAGCPDPCDYGEEDSREA